MNTDNERRSEPRSIADEYSSVEFGIGDLALLFQFKIWDTSPSGMSILVREDSDILKYIKAGDILDMKYYPTQSNKQPITLETEIRHITKDVEKRIKGHFLIGLSISKK